MKQKFFKIPASFPEEAETELNLFITQHRISHIERYFVADGMNSFWSICVVWLDSEGRLAENTMKRKPKIDYKEVLNETDFMIYAQLRDLRKEIAEREGTPVYNVFTNEQLAAIVQQRITSKTALLAVEGIGKTRVDKYASAFLECIKADSQRVNTDETHPNNT